MGLEIQLRAETYFSKTFNDGEEVVLELATMCLLGSCIETKYPTGYIDIRLIQWHKNYWLYDWFENLSNDEFENHTNTKCLFKEDLERFIELSKEVLNWPLDSKEQYRTFKKYFPVKSNIFYTKEDIEILQDTKEYFQELINNFPWKDSELYCYYNY